MNWIKGRLESAVEWLYTRTFINFIFGFPIATLFVTAAIISPFYYLTDIYFKVSTHLDEDVGQILLSFFLFLWIVIMVISAALLFALGSRTLKYVSITDRVNDLKTSGLVNKIQNNIYLIGLSLSPFTTEDWQNIFEKKLLSGVDIKLLVVDPATEYAINRHSSLRGKEDKLSDDIKTAINRYTKFKDYMSEKHGDVSNNFEVGLYSNNASMSTFICDDEIRLGLIIEKGTGLTAPEIRINKHGKQAALFKIITDHFNEVWKGAKKI
jgi:hypothetical protein